MPAGGDYIVLLSSKAPVVSKQEIGYLKPEEARVGFALTMSALFDRILTQNLILQAGHQHTFSLGPLNDTRPKYRGMKSTESHYIQVQIYHNEHSFYI